MNLALCILLASGLIGTQQTNSEFKDVTRFTVLPSATDPAINTFDSEHSIFINNKVKHRNELLIFIPGTGGQTHGVDSFCSTAANLGYHVINVMYPDTIPATIVRNEKDRNAFLNFRLEIIEGGDKSPAISVDRANSMENRLIKLLQYLEKSRATENWGQFLTAKGELEWSKIVPSGLSQGAGHAALIGIRHKVARVVMFGGPKDYDRAVNKPAGWYTPPATPIDRFFAFNHKQDKQGCDYKEQLEILTTMGMDSLGKAVDVDVEKPPFKGSHSLVTNYPGTTVPSGQAHVSVISDRVSPKIDDGSFKFKPVWVYMLTATVK